jgi:hypothetical protein
VVDAWPECKHCGPPAWTEEGPVASGHVDAASQPRALLQRLDDEQSVVVGHLDLGADDHLAETERHLALGATEVRRTPHWVTLRDPSGRPYCVTPHSVDHPAN